MVWLVLAGLLTAVGVIVLVGRTPKAEWAAMPFPTQVRASQPTAVRIPVPANSAQATATAILSALISRDPEALAGHVDAGGVRLSPSAFVDVETDRVMTPSEVRTLWTKKQPLFWGNAEATGDQILLTPADYFAQYVLDKDYKNAKINVNDNTIFGNTTNNIVDAYPGATSIEFLYKSKDKHDWSALRLVLVDKGAGWRLVGIVHDDWSP